MAHPIFDLAASEPLFDCSDLTSARTFLFPNWSGRVLLSNDNPVLLSDFASGGVIGTAAATVDIAQSALINQTTEGKVLTLPTPTSGLAVFYTLYNVGSAGFYTYGRYLRPGSAHTFAYVPTVGWRRTSSGPMIISQSAVAISVPADTSENTLVSITIPGGTIGANGRLVVETSFTITASTNSKTWRVRLGGTTLHSGVTASATAVTFDSIARIANRNSESSQIGSTFTGNGAVSTSLPTGTVDTSVDQTLIITGQKASGGETMTLAQYSIRLERAD